MKLVKNLLFVGIPAVVIVILILSSLAVCNGAGIIMGLGVGIITFFKLTFSDTNYKPWVRAGWALIMAVIFMAAMMTQNIWIIVMGVVVCLLTYTFIQYLTIWMNLQYIYDEETNGCVFWIIFFIVTVGGWYLIDKMEEDYRRLGAEFEQAEFVDIHSIAVEIYNHNTYYVVTTEDGNVIGVDARKFPEIRSASSDNKIRYVVDDWVSSESLEQPYLLELK